MAKPPDLIVLKRHRDLAGLAWTIWIRRAVVALLAALAALALANVFGQRPSTARAVAGAATLTVNAPTRLRSGLLYTARFTVTAHRELAKATLILDRGWAENITINTIEPSPVGEASDHGRLSLELGHVPAGGVFRLYMAFQVNPTAAGTRDQDVELRDGDAPVASLSHSVFVFP